MGINLPTHMQTLNKTIMRLRRGGLVNKNVYGQDAHYNVWYSCVFLGVFQCRNIKKSRIVRKF